MIIKHNGKKYEVEPDGQGADTYFASGCELSTLRELTEEELDELASECDNEIVEWNMETFGYWRD